MIGGPAQSGHQYSLRLEELASAFRGRFGEVEYGFDQSPSGKTRKLQITVAAPGWGLALEATLVLIEKHRLVREQWVPYEYAYDLHIEPRPSGRFAYHWARDVFHVHCVDPSEPPRDHHYKGAPVNDVFWAAETLFEMIRLGISCRGLQSLTDWVEDPGGAA